MPDRFRYLPCGLHPALDSRKDIAPNALCEPGDDGPCIDLAHPQGWDFAVRALAGIRGFRVDESVSVHFGALGHDRSEVFDLSYHPPVSIKLHAHNALTPEQRREALCRALCSALNLNVDEVFPT